MRYQKTKFIPPMPLLRTEKLPEGPEWLVELKLDGYRSLAIAGSKSAVGGPGSQGDFTARCHALRPFGHYL